MSIREPEVPNGSAMTSASQARATTHPAEDDLPRQAEQAGDR
jgi:hypothetical protein